MNRTREEFNEDRVEKWYAEQRYIEAQEMFLYAQRQAIEAGILPPDIKLYSPYIRQPTPYFVTMYEEGM